MALNTFGGGDSQVTVDANGTTVGGIQLTVWTTATKTVQVTSLYDLDGAALPGFVTSSTEAPPTRGRYAFKASDAYSLLWLWDGNPANDPWPVAAHEVLSQMGTAIQKADQATLDAASALDAATTATDTANAADSRSTSALSVAQGAKDDVFGALASLGRGADVDALTSPIWAPHRGGKTLAPENTMEAFGNAVSMGAKILELDAYLLWDGSLAVFHDGTLTRTSNLTAGWQQLSSAAVRNAKVDATSWFCNTWRGDIHVPMLDEVVREFGGRVVLMIEAKNPGSGQAIVDMVSAYGLQKSVIVASFDVNELVAPINEGIVTQLLLGSSDGQDWNALAASYDRVCVSAASGTGWIASAQAAGLKADVYGLYRRFDTQPFVDAGADMLICDDPWYSGSLVPVQTVDCFEAASFMPGMLAGDSVDGLTADRGGFYGASLDRFGWAGQTTSDKAFVLMGHMCPVANPAGTWTLDLTMNLGNIPASVYWGSVMICAPNDQPFNDAASPGVNGYHILFRASGDISVFRVDDGVATALGGATGTLTALGTGTNAQYRITISPTNVKAERLDVAAVADFADSTHRGPYFHLGSDAVNATFYDLAVA